MSFGTAAKLVKLSILVNHRQKEEGLEGVVNKGDSLTTTHTGLATILYCMTMYIYVKPVYVLYDVRVYVMRIFGVIRESAADG